MRRSTAAGLAVLGLVAGCGGGSGGSGGSGPAAPSHTVQATIGADGVQTVRIEGTDGLKFQPNTVRAKVGQLRIVYTTVGNTPHTLNVTSLHQDTGNVSHNQTKTLTVDLPRPGSYRFICDYHAAEGMTGTIIAH